MRARTCVDSRVPMDVERRTMKRTMFCGGRLEMIALLAGIWATYKSQSCFGMWQLALAHSVTQSVEPPLATEYELPLWLPAWSVIPGTWTVVGRRTRDPRRSFWRAITLL